MSRGPQPLKAKEAALPIAERRGLVQRYQHRRGNICDFSIMSPGLVSFVSPMRLIRLCSTPEDILHNYAKVIGQLRFIASSPGISRELWLRTPHGVWRFFRVLNDSIVELDRDGMPVANDTGAVKDPSPTTMTGPVAKAKPALPAGKNPAINKRVADGKKPEPKKDPEISITTEKNPEPANDSGLAKDTAQPAEPETIPGLIKKFLKQKKKGLQKDSESG
jgi:hypothetical protein